MYRSFLTHDLYVQIQEPIDIFLSHDWPCNIAQFGNTQELLRKKSFLAAEVRTVLCWSCGYTRPAFHYIQCLHCILTFIQCKWFYSGGAHSVTFVHVGTQSLHFNILYIYSGFAVKVRTKLRLVVCVWARKVCISITQFR